MLNNNIHFMIRYIMGISVLNLLSNKVLHYHNAIAVWLEFPDNLWLELTFFFPKGTYSTVDQPVTAKLQFEYGYL